MKRREIFVDNWWQDRLYNYKNNVQEAYKANKTRVLFVLRGCLLQYSWPSFYVYILSCLENERGHQDFIKHEATQKVTTWLKYKKSIFKVWCANTTTTRLMSRLWNMHMFRLRASFSEYLCYIPFHTLTY